MTSQSRKHLPCGMTLMHSSVFLYMVCVYHLSCYRGKKMEETYFDKETEKAFLKASGALYEKKVYPAMLLARENGNMYTASLYGGILSLLAQ